MFNVYAQQYAAPSAAAHMTQTITDDQRAVLEEQLLSQFECGEITAMQYSQQSDALLRLKS